MFSTHLLWLLIIDGWTLRLLAPLLIHSVDLNAVFRLDSSWVLVEIWFCSAAEDIDYLELLVLVLYPASLPGSAFLDCWLFLDLGLDIFVGLSIWVLSPGQDDCNWYLVDLIKLNWSCTRADLDAGYVKWFTSELELIGRVMLLMDLSFKKLARKWARASLSHDNVSLFYVDVPTRWSNNWC